MTEQTHRLPPLFQTNEVLFGHDSTPGLVAFEVQRDKVTIFSRDGDATLSQTVPFEPFLLAASDGKKRNAAAPYDLVRSAKRPYQPGDQISYYVTGAKAKVKINENCKLASDWDPKKPDENVEHYKAKLNERYEKFRPFIEDGATRSEELELALSCSDSAVGMETQH